MYHRVSNTRGDDSAVLPHEFKRQMEFLAEFGYQVLDLGDLVSAVVSKKPLTNRSVVLTFDDGFDETHAETCAILKKHNYPATFFLISGLIGKYADWMLNRPRLMNWDDARSLVRDGFAIGSHALTHCRLDHLSTDDAREEIFRSKRVLEDGLGVAVRSFAYPFGSWNGTLRNLVIQSGYDGACTTQCGFNGDASDIFALRRIDIDGQYSLSMFERSLAFGENHMSLTRQLRYYSRRLFHRALFPSAT